MTSCLTLSLSFQCLWPKSMSSCRTWLLFTTFECFLLVCVFYFFSLCALRGAGWRKTHDHDERLALGPPLILRRRKGRGCLKAKPCWCNQTRRDILSSIPPPAPHDSGSGHFCFLHFLPSPSLALGSREEEKKKRGHVWFSCMATHNK